MELTLRWERGHRPLGADRPHPAPTAPVRAMSGSAPEEPDRD